MKKKNGKLKNVKNNVKEKCIYDDEKKLITTTKNHLMKTQNSKFCIIFS